MCRNQPQDIDPHVLKKLKELVRVKGITQTESIKAQLEEYVQTVLYTRETAPVTSNKRFFPEHKTLYNYITPPWLNNCEC